MGSSHTNTNSSSFYKSAVAVAAAAAAGVQSNFYTAAAGGGGEFSNSNVMSSSTAAPGSSQIMIEPNSSLATSSPIVKPIPILTYPFLNNNTASTSTSDNSLKDMSKSANKILSNDEFLAGKNYF